jgi:hypothetical protein
MKLLIVLGLVILALLMGQTHNHSNMSNVGLLGMGSTLASAATIAPTNLIHHVSGTTTINTITVPTNFPVGGYIVLIADGVFLTTNVGNISLASTSVIGKSLILVWDGTKWNPSY